MSSEKNTLIKEDDDLMSQRNHPSSSSEAQIDHRKRKHSPPTSGIDQVSVIPSKCPKLVEVDVHNDKSLLCEEGNGRSKEKSTSKEGNNKSQMERKRPGEKYVNILDEDKDFGKKAKLSLEDQLTSPELKEDFRTISTDDNDSVSCMSSGIHPRPYRKRTKFLLKTVLEQMEFYFSDSNLSKDRYVKHQIDQSEDGYVNLSVFGNFNKLQALHKDGVSSEILLKALQRSKFLQLSEDNTRVRRITPFKPISQEETDRRTIYVENLPSQATQSWIRTIFSKCGKVTYVSLPVYKTTREKKGFAFVEFETAEQAAKACTLNNPPPEKATEKPGKFPKSNKTLSRLQKIVPEQDSNEENVSDDQKSGPAIEPGKKKKKKKGKKTKSKESISEEKLEFSASADILEGKKKKKKKKKKKRLSLTLDSNTDQDRADVSADEPTKLETEMDSINKYEEDNEDKVQVEEKESQMKDNRIKADVKDEEAKPSNFSENVEDNVDKKAEILTDIKNEKSGAADDNREYSFITKLTSFDEKLNKSESEFVSGETVGRKKKRRKKKKKPEEEIEGMNFDGRNRSSLGYEAPIEKEGMPVEYTKIEASVEEASLTRKERKRLRQEDIRRKKMETQLDCERGSNEYLEVKTSEVRDRLRSDLSSNSQLTDSEYEDPGQVVLKQDGSQVMSILRSRKKAISKKVEFDLVPETKEYVSGKEVRRRRKSRNKEKIHLRVISKKEWENLRSEYIKRQKSHMTALKESLRELRQQEQENHEKSEAKGPKHVDLEDVFGTKRLKPSQDVKMAHVEALKFIPNVIVQWKCTHEMHRDKIRAMFKDFGGSNIAYVDAQEEAKSGHIRFKDAESAESFAKASRNSLGSFFSARMLPYEQQQAYWDKANEDRMKRLGRKKQEKGSERLARKVFERNKATFTKKPSRIVFGDDDDDVRDDGNRDETREQGCE